MSPEMRTHVTSLVPKAFKEKLAAGKCWGMRLSTSARLSYTDINTCTLTHPDRKQCTYGLVI